MIPRPVLWDMVKGRLLIIALLSTISSIPTTRAATIAAGHRLEGLSTPLTPQAIREFVPSLPGYGKLDFGLFSG